MENEQVTKFYPGFCLELSVRRGVADSEKQILSFLNTPPSYTAHFIGEDMARALVESFTPNIQNDALKRNMSMVSESVRLLIAQCSGVELSDTQVRNLMSRAHREGGAFPLVTTDRILQEVLAERRRQHEKWGKQDFPDGTKTTESNQQYLSALKEKNDEAATKGSLSFAEILREEFVEAVTEENPDNLRKELVQVAAVCVQWIQAIDERKGKVDEEDGHDET